MPEYKMKGNVCELLNFLVFGPLAFYLWDRRNIALKVEEARYTEAVQRQSEETMKAVSNVSEALKSKINAGSVEGTGEVLKQEATDALTTIKNQVKATAPRSLFNRVHFMVPVYVGLGLYWLSHKIGCPIDKYFQNPLPINPAPSADVAETKEAPTKEKVVYIVKSPDEVKKELEGVEGSVQK